MVFWCFAFTLMESRGSAGCLVLSVLVHKFVLVLLDALNVLWTLLLQW